MKGIEDGSIESTVEIISNKDILLSLTITEIVIVDTDQVFKDIREIYEKQFKETTKKICSFLKNCDDYYSFSIEINKY